MLAEESLDALIEPLDDAADEASFQPGGASITWRGDGKYLATVGTSTGKSPVDHATLNAVEYKHVMVMIHGLIHKRVICSSCQLT